MESSCAPGASPFPPSGVGSNGRGAGQPLLPGPSEADDARRAGPQTDKSVYQVVWRIVASTGFTCENLVGMPSTAREEFASFYFLLRFAFRCEVGRQIIPTRADILQITREHWRDWVWTYLSMHILRGETNRNSCNLNRECPGRSPCHPPPQSCPPPCSLCSKRQRLLLMDEKNHPSLATTSP